jgi:hypothetical protein
MKKVLAPLLALAAMGTATLVSDDARACGGCFHPVTESTVVTGHRMAVSISKTQAVLWDQIQYAGDPAEFSWVLPIKKGAYVEVATDAFFDVLETGTATTVEAPPEGCIQGGGDDGFDCGTSLRAADEAASFGTGGGPNMQNGVQVVHQGTVGPYETVTLSAENPNALAEWLEDNGYVLPDEVKPIVDAYVEEEFDFIALKLQPDSGVSAMKPVRVITPGSSYTLPLRMVAAGVGESVDIVLHVLGEGRYEAASFENATVTPELVTWDFEVDRSDYAEQRLGILGGNGGRTWLTSYAHENAILGRITDPITGGTVGYNIGDNFQFSDTIAGAYFLQGFENGEANMEENSGCISDLQQISGSGVVTDLCDDEGNCSAPAAGQIDARLLTCGGLDDLAVALEGMHPQDVWVTRLEANLPVEALDADLRLEASSDQATVENRFQAGLKVNPCWDQQDSGAPLLDDKSGPRLPPSALILLTLGAAGIALALRRRASLPSQI